jgi:hypothetical protein
MIDESKLRKFVSEQVCAVHAELFPDNRGIESAPYSRHASPMARYWPMTRLLDDADYECLPMSDRRSFRKARRQIYRAYVDDLSEVVEALLLEHAESGCITLDALREESVGARRCIRQLRGHSLRHWMGLSGVPDLVAGSIRDLTAALHLGELVVMPLPVQASA